MESVFSEQCARTEQDYLIRSFSADNYCEDAARRTIEERYAPILELTDKFNRRSVSYQMSKNDALHSWLKYKEGFSADLVNTLLDEMHLRAGDWVLDPFVGSGTTPLVCRNRGINSIGYDILPLSSAAVAAKGAVLRYSLQELRTLIGDVETMHVPSGYEGRMPSVAITRDAYPRENERFIQYLTEWMEASPYSQDARNLLKLCVLNSLERCSYTSKAGQYLAWDCRSPKVIRANEKRAAQGKPPLARKYVRKIIENAQVVVVEELRRIADEIALLQRQGASHTDAKIEFACASALYELPKLPDEFLAGVITSPPYCNRYDYTRTYALELAYLGFNEDDFKTARQELLSCTVENKPKLSALRDFYEEIGEADRFHCICRTTLENAVYQEVVAALEKRRKHGDLNNDGVIRMVEGYFQELALIFAELYRICRKGAQVAFVNDNVRFGGEVIPVDFLCTSLAEQFGFVPERVYTLRQQKGNSSQQMAKFGRVALRKSITVWTKR